MDQQRRHPWERYKKETSKAFEGFSIYRSLGVGRSLDQAGKKLGKSAKLLGQWSAKWNWVERCAAWDAHLEAERIKAEEDQVRGFAKEVGGLRKSIISSALRSLKRKLDDGTWDTLLDGTPSSNALASSLIGLLKEARDEADEGPTTRIALAAAEVPTEAELADVIEAQLSKAAAMGITSTATLPVLVAHTDEAEG